MIFLVTGLSLHLSSDLSNDQSNSVIYKGVLNEQLDDHILVKNDDKKHFSVVLSITVIAFKLAIVKSPIILTPKDPFFQERFFTPIFFQSNYINKSPL